LKILGAILRRDIQADSGRLRILILHTAARLGVIDGSVVEPARGGAAKDRRATER